MTAPVRPQAGARPAAAAFIFVTVMLDMLALGMIIPVLPLLIQEFRGGDTALAARTVGIFASTWAAIQFIASPVLGALSDRYGRRPVILLSNFGLGADYVLMALSPTLGWLYAGRVLSGVTSASIPTAYAYIADVTPPEKRAKAYGMLGAAFGIGFTVGPALGGILGAFGPRTPFWVAAAFSFANAMYGLFVLPESHHVDDRATFSWKRANPAGALSMLLAARGLRGFAVLHFLNNLAHQSLQSVFVLYAGYRYGWDSHHVGWSLAAVGVGFAVVQGGLVGRIVAALGERRTMLLGLSAGIVGFSIYGLAPTGPLFLIGLPIMAFWGMYNPSLQSMITRRVDRTMQGRLQGGLASVVMLTGLVGPVVFSETFAAAIRADPSLPGAPFLLAAALCVAAGAVALRIAHGEDAA